ncbi:MAG TPA: endonuclease/exonuclease/phosphatase family protein [Acidimicrobiia bacterium]|nr:endonuclease/exonuclease/phosphatase family protein [Acidimicrobiia bacterium]
MKRVLLALLAIGLLAGCSSGAKESTVDLATAPSIRVVSQNILHGSACAPETDRCAAPDRVALFVRQLGETGCPELVSLQESNAGIVELFEKELPKVCDGKYTIVRDGDAGNDRETVLTTLPVLGSRRDRLAGPLRTMFWVRAASDAGIVEFVSTHLASGSDDRPCDATTCPPPCATTDSLNTCQAKQLVARVDELAHPDAIRIIGGDMNAKPDEPTIAVFTDAGYHDTHLAAGNPECNRATGEQCTGGRIDDSLVDMRNPESKQSERIDYLFVGGNRDCAVGKPTGLFNDGAPATDGPAGLAFPSDHTGVQATLSCPTTAAEKAAAEDGPLPTTTTTAPADTATNDPATKAAITKSFETLFNGDVDGTELKLAVLEDAERLRPLFVKTFEQQKELAEKIRVRIDRVDVVDSTNANVEYSLLLDGAAVLDHLPGAAVKPGTTWLVSRTTFCDVALQGVKEIPAACQ